MRLLLLSAEYPPTPGGVGDYTQRLGQALGASGLDVGVVSIRHHLLQLVDWFGPNPPSALTGQPLHAWNWRCWSAIDTVLRQFQPDIFHIQYQTGAYAMHPAINLLPWHLRRQHQPTRIAVTAHDLLVPYLFPKAGALRPWITQRLLRDVPLPIVTNDLDQQALPFATTMIPIGSNIRVAPPAGYDRTQFRAAHGLAPDQPVLISFGLLSRTKGVDQILASLAQLPPQVRVVLLGGEATSPEDRQFASQIRQQVASTWPERVLITGQLDDPLVSAWLLAADLGVLPFTDGASLRRGSLLALLSHGVPVVTTAPAHPPQTNSLAAQLLQATIAIPANNPAALSAAIINLLYDQTLQARLRAAGPAFMTQLSWDAIANQHLQAYQQLG